MSDKKYEVKEELGVFCKQGAVTGAIRRVSWYNKEEKIDIRKWTAYNTEAEYGKSGIALTTDETHKLTETLVDLGFGDKDKIQESLNTRTREWVEIPKEQLEEPVEDEEDYYDPKTDLF